MTRRPPWDAVRVPHVIAAALAVTLLIAGGVAASTSTTSFGSHNPAWDGGSDLRTLADAQADVVLADNTSRYEALGQGDVAFLLSPDDTYDDHASAAVESFVANGGTLVVAGDVTPGPVNDLLDALGADTRIDGTPVRDERANYRSPAFPVATNVTTHPLTSGVDELTLNHGTVLDPSQDADVLVRTSPYAYLDSNGNEELDDEEELTTYPVVAVESVDAGRIVVVSDPSVFINTMLDRPGNAAFARAIVADAGVVLFDYSHTAGFPPLVAVLVALRSSLALQVGLVLVLGSGAAVLVRRQLPWPGGSEDDEVLHGIDAPESDLVAALAAEHPEWDRSRIERVTEGINYRHSKEENDG